MTPRAAIIIPHRDDPDRLDRCLMSLVVPGGVEVIVVDNGSATDIAPLIDRHTGTRLVREPTPGAGPARNAGVAATGAPILLFLDADCIAAPNWVQTALDLMTDDMLIGGAVAVFDETAPPRSGAQAFEAVFAFDNRSYIKDQGFSVTANLATTRAIFDATGPFRAGLSEDKDWCLRACAAGFSIRYSKAMRVSHPSRGDWPALARKWRRLTEEAAALHRASGGSPVAWWLRALAMPLSAIAHAPKILLARNLTWGERWRGFGTLIRLRCARLVWMLR
ncbi:glycosyltransferase family 2 protein [Jannaschia pohangensis]|uniref:Glycosyltransferase, GT2 family n=1 Tax=Jannaschia pohangensis TaxID=390807 RepID=A0A1I3TTX9_9RHOB|nr:glycosyltransferase family 2 protein [Jannaschia pohangensis]SFJ73943.1 Glycosyltransferase, GT2 family [Jannaschia pohangensis]